MALEISFSNPINSSLQVGDSAYISYIVNGLTTGNPQFIGKVIDIEQSIVTVDDDGSWTFDSSQDTLFLFSKPIEINESGLKGYYADVTFKNESRKRVELFAISSEAVISSK